MKHGGPVLRDIHLPPAPSWWPPAPGWWILAALLLIALPVLWYLGRRSHRRRALWRSVERELDALPSQPASDLAAGISQLMRRAARLRDPAAGGARGQAWTQLVGRHLPDERDRRLLQDLPQAIYRRHAVIDVAATRAAARRWLRAALRRGGRRA